VREKYVVEEEHIQMHVCAVKKFILLLYEKEQVRIDNETEREREREQCKKNTLTTTSCILDKDSRRAKVYVCEGEASHLS